MSDAKKSKNRQIIIIAAGVFVVLVLFVFLSGRFFGESKSGVSSDMNMNKSFGNKEAVKKMTPAYQNELQARNEEAKKDGELRGKTVLPLLSAAVEPQVKKEPKAAPEVKVEPQAKKQEVRQEDPAVAQAKLDAMRRHVETLLLRPLPGRVLVSGVFPNENRTTGASPGQQHPSMQQVSSEPSKVVARAGEIHYAVLENPLNTDEPELARFSVIQGPLKGAVFIGSIKRSNESIDVDINQAFFNQQSWTVKGKVIDPATSRTVLSGDVDHKYMTRFGLPFLTGLLGAAGQAISQGSNKVVATEHTTTVTNDKMSGRQIAGAAVASGMQGVVQGVQRQSSEAQIAVSVPSSDKTGMVCGIWLLTDMTSKTGNVPSPAVPQYTQGQPHQGFAQPMPSMVDFQRQVATFMPPPQQQQTTFVSPYGSSYTTTPYSPAIQPVQHQYFKP